MSAKVDMGSFHNSGLEQRLASLGKNETGTKITLSEHLQTVSSSRARVEESEGES